jgi:hypothetical protein
MEIMWGRPAGSTRRWRGTALLASDSTGAVLAGRRHRIQRGPAARHESIEWLDSYIR